MTTPIKGAYILTEAINCSELHKIILLSYGPAVTIQVNIIAEQSNLLHLKLGNVTEVTSEHHMPGHSALKWKKRNFENSSYRLQLQFVKNLKKILPL